MSETCFSAQYVLLLTQYTIKICGMPSVNLSFYNSSCIQWIWKRYYLMYLLTAVGLAPGGSSTVHIYIQTIHRATQWKENIQNRTYITTKIHKYNNKKTNITIKINHHKHQGLDSLVRSVSKVTTALSLTFLRSSNCSPSLWSVVVWFQWSSVLWHSLQVLKPVPSVFIYLI